MRNPRQAQLGIPADKNHLGRILLIGSQFEPRQRIHLVFLKTIHATGEPRAHGALRGGFAFFRRVAYEFGTLCRVARHQIARQMHATQQKRRARIADRLRPGDVLTRLQFVARTAQAAHQHLAHIGHRLRVAFFGRVGEFLARIEVAPACKRFHALGHARIRRRGEPEHTDDQPAQ